MRSDKSLADLERWHESGRFGGAWLLLPLGLVAATVASWLYVAVTTWVPFVGYFTALIAVGLGIATSLPIALAAPKLKVRSVPAMRAIGAFAGLAAVYMAWVWFTWRIVEEAQPGQTSLAEWAVSPGLVAQVAEAVAADGSFTLGVGVTAGPTTPAGGLTPRGQLLWLLWLVEAALIIVPCIVLAPREITGRPFCERCNAWMPLQAHLPFVTPATAKSLRERGLCAITTAASPRPDAESSWLLSSWRCATCDAGVFRVDRTFGFVANNLLSPKWSPISVRALESIVPASLQRPGDDAEIERIVAEAQSRTE